MQDEEAGPTKGEASRQRIVEAAYSLFLEQGYHGTAMRQIAERAGLTMGGVYNHFDGKESIWEAVFMTKHPYRTILPLILRAQGGTVAEFMRGAAADVVAELNRHDDLLNLMFIEIVEFNGRHLPDIFRAVTPLFGPLADRFRALQGELRPLPQPILVRSFAGLFFSFYITERLMPPEVRSLMGEDALGAFVDIYLHGILQGPPAGTEPQND
jgi:AcrR family transcriptional regulator